MKLMLTLVLVTALIFVSDAASIPKDGQVADAVEEAPSSVLSWISNNLPSIPSKEDFLSGISHAQESLSGLTSNLNVRETVSGWAQSAVSQVQFLIYGLAGTTY